MSRLPILVLAVLALAVAPAHAASTKLTIRGAGFGHGIGMSQYGAYGMALNGWSHQRILRHYYSGTTLGTVEPGQTVRVLLQSSSRGSFVGASRAGGKTVDPARRYVVRRAGLNRLDLLNARGRKLKTVTAPLRVSGPGPVVLLGTAGNGRTNGAYRGALEFHAEPRGGVYAVNAVGLDDYLQGVVPDESPPTWPLEALKAQAIAARSYALTTSKGGAGYDQFADTRSQVYGGVAAEEASTNQAVEQTSGQVVTYGGVPVTTYFFSTSGGRTEDVENSWPGAEPKPWLKSVEDPYDDLSPKHRWGPIRLSMAQARAKLRGLVKGKLRGIRVVQRGHSPRVVYADVVGSKGRTRVTGPTLRTRFGLYDTWMYFTSLTALPEPAPEPEPAPDTPPSGGVVAPSGQAARGRAAGYVAGHAFGLGRAAKVRVQQRYGRRWLTVATTRVRPDGRYRAAVYDQGTYRVLGPGLTGPRVRVR